MFKELGCGSLDLPMSLRSFLDQLYLSPEAEKGKKGGIKKLFPMKIFSEKTAKVLVLSNECSVIKNFPGP